jgi:RNA polymerase sigma-70 factor (ECF subfamily)
MARRNDKRSSSDRGFKKTGRTRELDFEKEALEHLDAMYAMALRLTRNEHTAEDLVQDTIVKAFRFHESYETGSNMKAWLFKILTNTFYNSVRKVNNIKKLETEAETGWHYERFISSASSSSQEVEDRLLDAISAERINAAIDELSDEFKTVVVLCDVHGFSYKEIADIVDCPVGTVMSRLYRGRRQLQKRLYTHALERGLISESFDGESAEKSSEPGKKHIKNSKVETSTHDVETDEQPLSLSAYRAKVGR